jgi:hypothetical protein
MVVGVLTASAWGEFPDFDNNLIVDINDLAIFTDFWLLYTTEPEDLDGSGFVNFKDYSIFSTDWKKSCCDNNNFAVDPNYFKNWQWVNFTGVTNTCPIDWCIYFGDDDSDPCNDRCGNWVIKSCEETPDMGYTCDYNYYHNGWRVGLCVYNCGQNGFWILKNKTGCRILATMHFVCDTPPQDPQCPWYGCPEECDEGTPDYYNWQLVITWYPDPSNPNYSQQTGICHQATTLPDFIGESTVFFGSSGPCKYHWWPY